MALRRGHYLDQKDEIQEKWWRRVLLFGVSDINTMQSEYSKSKVERRPFFSSIH